MFAMLDCTLDIHAASALAELGGLPSSDGRVYGVGGKVVLPDMKDLGVDPDTSDDEISSIGGSSGSGSDGDDIGGSAPGRSAALARRRSGGAGAVDSSSSGGGSGGKHTRRGRGQGQQQQRGQNWDAAPIEPSRTSLSSFPSIR
jgi:hypothetical protein